MNFPFAPMTESPFFGMSLLFWMIEVMWSPSILMATFGMIFPVPGSIAVPLTMSLVPEGVANAGAARVTAQANRRSRFIYIMSGETSVLVRGNDETKTGRRAGAVAGREMGGVRRGRCRSRGEYENLPSLDRVRQSDGLVPRRARSRRRSAPVESNAESRGAAALFTGREAAHLDFEGDRPDANLDMQFHAGERRARRPAASGHEHFHGRRRWDLVAGREKHRVSIVGLSGRERRCGKQEARRRARQKQGEGEDLHEAALPA